MSKENNIDYNKSAPPTVIMAAAVSANGLITHGSGNQQQAFTSNEDSEHINRLYAKADVIILGSTTYQVMKARVNHDTTTRYVVLTGSPNAYPNLPGHIHATNEPPAAIVKQAKAAGMQTILVAGGSRVYSSFAAANVVDELYLTIEPCLFSGGTPFIGPDLSNATLRLLECRQLNPAGTLLLHYAFNV